MMALKIRPAPDSAVDHVRQALAMCNLMQQVPHKYIFTYKYNFLSELMCNAPSRILVEKLIVLPRHSRIVGEETK